MEEPWPLESFVPYVYVLSQPHANAPIDLSVYDSGELRKCCWEEKFTIVIADAAIQVDISLFKLAVFAAQEAAQETSFLEADGLEVAGLAEVASHFWIYFVDGKGS